MHVFPYCPCLNIASAFTAHSRKKHITFSAYFQSFVIFDIIKALIGRKSLYITLHAFVSCLIGKLIQHAFFTVSKFYVHILQVKDFVAVKHRQLKVQSLFRLFSDISKNSAVNIQYMSVYEIRSV